ncbi:MAG: HD domain-containing protein, partial [Chloroflexota bacterium]
GKLFMLAKPYLERNDLGAAHTSRVLNIAEENFTIPQEIKDLTITSIILHDIGGPTIKEQYAKGPKLVAMLLRQMNCDDNFIAQVCQIVGTHHDHPENPSLPFRILYDSDKLVMFSPEEFSGYNSAAGFDWNKIIGLLYSEKAKTMAKRLLRERLKEESTQSKNQR